MPSHPEPAARLAWLRRHGWFLAKRGILGLSLAGLVFGRQAFSFLDSSNPYYYFWEFQDGLAFLLNMVLFAGMLLGLSLLRDVVRGRTTSLVFDLGFLLVLADGLLNCLCPPKFRLFALYEAFTGAVLLGLTALVLLIRPASRARMIGYARDMVLILSPLPIAIAVIIFGLPEWGPKPRVPVRERPSPRLGQSHPVFLFVFDEWSFDRSTRDGAFLDSLKNLRAFSEQSLWFTQAYSRSFKTEKSLPAILFQTDREYVVGNRETSWCHGATVTPTSSMPSLFQRARDCGYRTALVGFYHPYHRVLEGQLDDCETYCHVSKGTNFLGRMAAMALWHSRTLTNPVLHRFGSFLNSPYHRRHWFGLNVRILEATEGLVARCSPNTLAVIHWPCPHEPFVFNRDGGYLHIGRLEQLRNYAAELLGDSSRALSAARYDQAIHQMDRFIGQVIAALRISGKYDDAMIILTSDHSWRADPLARTDRAKNPHVPLVIKMPGQTRRHVIDRTVVNYRIQDLIEGVLKDGLDTQRAVELIAAGWLPGPPE